MNMDANPEWIQLEDLPSLEALRDLLGQLEEILDCERAAVGALDQEQLTTATAAKHELIRNLEQLAEPVRDLPDDAVIVRSDDMEHRRLRAEAADYMMRVRAKARANALLLRDAMDAVSAALGIDPGAATYDKRARQRPFSRSNIIRAV